MKEKTLRPAVIIWCSVAVVLVGAILAALFFLRPQWKDTQDGRCYLRYGQKLLSWQELDGATYYFDPETGVMQTGTLSLPDGTYLLNEKGQRLTGWQDTAKGRLYFDENGRMVTDWQEILGSTYYFHPETGVMQTGTLLLPEGKYLLNESGQRLTGWQETDEGRLHFGEDGRMTTGWLQEPDGRIYLDENGQLVTGWLRLDSGTWYLKEDGHPYTGWMQTDEARYYFLEDGAMAVGKHKIGEISRYFSSDGNYIPLVNPWNPVPEDYTPKLVSMGRRSIDSTCVPAFEEMEAAAEEAGLNFVLNSGHRTLEKQTKLWNKRYNKYRKQGYSKDKSYRLTARRVAYPGTSEHHTGLAIDVMDLDGDGKLYAWFRDHAWEYGFVVRYRGDKESITGIMNEPWHLRYVGKEVSKILYEKDLCLEEFLGELPPQE